MREAPTRRAVLAGSASLLAWPGRAAQGAGVALVIGNARYLKEASLPNARRDTSDVAQRFQAYGLQTELVQDADQKAMLAAIDRFKGRAKGANFAAFYFAGHGADWDRATFLVPVDGDLSTPSNVTKFVPMGPVLAAVRGAQHRMMVFDNCRNNPADGWRQRAAEDGSRGNVGDARWLDPNTALVWSTVAGRIALDGPAGQNSPFATAFLRQFGGTPVEMRGLGLRLRRQVLIATEARQIVSDRNTFEKSFILAPIEGAGVPPAPAAAYLDPARITELPNAYALARQEKLMFAGGLFALKPPPGQPHANKVGAYRFENDNGAAILAVMSVAEEKAAEIFLAYRRFNQVNWAFLRGRIANDRLEVAERDGGPQHVFTWQDGSGGSVAILVPGQNSVQGRFSRLD